MEHWNWQLVPVTVCIAGAACYLLWNLVQFVRGTSSSGCHGSGCEGCSSSEVSDSLGNKTPFVSLESLETKSD